MARVNPRVSRQQPVPNPWRTLPATPQVYLSKRAQKRPKQPRIEGDRANFDEFHEISHISFSFGPKKYVFGLVRKPTGTAIVTRTHTRQYPYPEPGPGYPNPCHSLNRSGLNTIRLKQ